MYAKALIPGDPVDVPMLMLTVGERTPIISQLHEKGWSAYGGELLEADGEIVMPVAGGLELTVEGTSFIRDTSNPVSPPGWWEAVAAVGDNAMVVVMPHGFDMRAGIDMSALLARAEECAMALVKVTHGVG